MRELLVGVVGCLCVMGLSAVLMWVAYTVWNKLITEPLSRRY